MKELTQLDPVQLFAIAAILFGIATCVVIAINFDKQFDNQHDDQTFI